MSPLMWFLLIAASPFAWVAFVFLFWFVLPWIPFRRAETRQALDKVSEKVLKWSFGLLVAAVAMVAFLMFLPMSPFEHALGIALSGESLTAGSKYVVDCKGIECDGLLRRLPPVSEVHCFSSVGWIGACCRASFGELGSAEIHVYWRLFRYTIELTEPRMRDVLGALAQQSSE